MSSCPFPTTITITPQALPTKDFFNIAHRILVQFLSSFFYVCLYSVHVVHPYSSIDNTTAWKKSCFILLDTSDSHIIDSLLIVVHTFDRHILTSLPEDWTLLLKYTNLSTNFTTIESRDGSFLIQICFVCIHMETNAFCCLFQAM